MVSPTLCISRYPYLLLFYPRSLAVSGAGTLYLHLRHRDPSGDLSSVSRPVTGYNSCARTAQIIGTLDIDGHYPYRFNIRPRVVTPFKAQGIAARHRYY
jgi:hypothetical protein